MHACRVQWLAIVVALVAQGADARAQVDADTLKAAFIYNFAVYTTWPAPARDAHAITLCVARDSDLAPALRELAGKSVQRRSLVVNEIDAGARRADECDILIVAPTGPETTSPERGLLTVCDCDDQPGAAGSTIALVREGDRLRFDVDRRLAAAAGLSLSSKLLRLARNAP